MASIARRPSGVRLQPAVATSVLRPSTSGSLTSSGGPAWLALKSSTATGYSSV